ncbi:MAG: 2-oxoacid:ferredoxin oxidoreductase subunit beta, partial [Nitrososphaerales archaeon]
NPNINQGVNPIALALVSGFTFIARGYSYDIKHLKELIRKAVEHKGLAFLDVLQPCPTYNDIYTKQWFAGADNIDPETKKPMPRPYKLEESGYDPVVHNGEDIDELNAKMAQVIAKTSEWGSRIPVGVFYQNEHTPTYEERIGARIEHYRTSPPARQAIESEGRPTMDIGKLLAELKASRT